MRRGNSTGARDNYRKKNNDTLDRSQRTDKHPRNNTNSTSNSDTRSTSSETRVGRTFKSQSDSSRSSFKSDRVNNKFNKRSESNADVKSSTNTGNVPFSKVRSDSPRLGKEDDKFSKRSAFNSKASSESRTRGDSFKSKSASPSRSSFNSDKGNDKFGKRSFGTHAENRTRGEGVAKLGESSSHLRPRSNRREDKFAKHSDCSKKYDKYEKSDSQYTRDLSSILDIEKENNIVSDKRNLQRRTNPNYGKPFVKKVNGHNRDGFKSSDAKLSPSRPRTEHSLTTKNDSFTANKYSNRKQTTLDADYLRLNQYLSHAGICSRRKADDFIKAGVVSVNGNVVTELGFKVHPHDDEVRYNGELVKRQKLIYILLNKPKDYITTTDDPQERKTVMDLIAKATKERVYPVGRLDRNTTGLLLLTNDGDLADKLTHPKNNISKIYHVELNRNLTQGDFNKLAFGLELEDGFIKPDDISYVQGGTKREIGIKIHSGKNRIVRRMFESLGYEVLKLDRVYYANLTKKDLPRSKWRFLEPKEIIQLKHLLKVNH